LNANHQIGRFLTKLGHHKEAIVAHQNAVRLQAEEAAASLLSMEDWDPGEYGPDLVEMDRGLIGDALEELGKAYLLAGQLPDAEEAFRKALNLEPNSVRAHGCLALAHSLMDKRSIAAEEFKIAAARARLMIEHRPESASAHGDLAFVYRVMGDDLAAKEEYQRACELGWRADPDEDIFAIAARGPHTAEPASGDQ
jgi:tetratricopeptide (TPR) repeat protein